MMKLTLLLSCLTLGLLVTTSCQTTKMDVSAPAADNTKVKSQRSFDEDVERYSAGEVEYAGLYNNFEYKATLMNSFIRDAQLEKQTGYYQWDNAKASQEREKSNQEMSSQTKVFMAFFTPNAKNDNLTEDKSIWKVYLDSGGRRYEGKIKRIRTLLAELQALYPYMTRWATAYEVTFDVPTAAVEQTPSSYTVTGPLGSRAVTFNAL